METIVHFRKKLTPLFFLLVMCVSFTNLMAQPTSFVRTSIISGPSVTTTYKLTPNTTYDLNSSITSSQTCGRTFTTANSTYYSHFPVYNLYASTCTSGATFTFNCSGVPSALDSIKMFAIISSGNANMTTGIFLGGTKSNSTTFTISTTANLSSVTQIVLCYETMSSSNKFTINSINVIRDTVTVNPPFPPITGTDTNLIFKTTVQKASPEFSSGVHLAGTLTNNNSRVLGYIGSPTYQYSALIYDVVNIANCSNPKITLRYAAAPANSFNVKVYAVNPAYNGTGNLTIGNTLLGSTTISTGGTSTIIPLSNLTGVSQIIVLSSFMTPAASVTVSSATLTCESVNPPPPANFSATLVASLKKTTQGIFTSGKNPVTTSSVNYCGYTATAYHAPVYRIGGTGNCSQVELKIRYNGSPVSSMPIEIYNVSPNYVSGDTVVRGNTLLGSYTIASGQVSPITIPLSNLTGVSQIIIQPAFAQNAITITNVSLHCRDYQYIINGGDTVAAYRSYDSLGNVSSSVHIEPISNNAYCTDSPNNRPFINKVVTLTPQNQGSADIILYFTPQELNDLIARSQVIPGLELDPDPAIAVTQLGISKYQHNFIIGADCRHSAPGVTYFSPANITVTLVNGIYQVAFSITGFSTFVIHKASEPLSSNDLSVNFKVEIFPNPAHSELNILTSNFTPQKIEIVDIYGRVIAVQTNTPDKIDISKLSEGTYFLNLYSAEYKISKKFVKQ